VSERSKETTEAISALLLNEPFWASLLFDLLEVVECKNMPSGSQLNVAATDGQRLYLNPDTFGKFTVQERCGVIAHELLHVIMQHPGRMRAWWELGIGPDMKPFSGKRFNIAADYIINAQLVQSGFKLPLGSLQNSQITQDDIVDEVYHKVPEDEDDDNNWDSHEMGDAAQQPNKPQLQAAVQKAAAMAKMQGKGIGGMGRLIQEICEPQITWQEHLRTAMVMSATGNDVHTWARPNRRKLATPPHLYWPGRTGMHSPEGCVVIDTSGSIGDHELKTFLGELQGILTDVQPEKVHVMYIDDGLHNDEVHEIEDVNDLLELGKKAGGGGGTNMPHAFTEVANRQLPIQWMVILTDGYTPFGEDPGYPVIWCSTTDQKSPWGTTVHVKLPKE
jgi:predicted metal-dependent peptidase